MIQVVNESAASVILQAERGFAMEVNCFLDESESSPGSSTSKDTLLESDV